MEYVLVNVSLQFYAAAMLLVLIICQLFSPQKYEKRNRIFLQMLIMNFSVLILDNIAWLTEGRPDAISIFLMKASNLGAYLLAVLNPILLLSYSIEHISPPRRVVTAVSVICGTVFASYLILLILTQFNGALYYYNENNIYKTGDYYYLFIIAGLSLLFLDGGLVLYYHRKLKVRSTLSYLIYSLLPVFFIWLNLFHPNIMIAHVGNALSLLIVYVNVHLQQERKLEEHKLEMERNRAAIMLSQIQPHFLYNTLNAIGNLYSDNPEAHKSIITFSEYLRANMDSLTRQEPIPFTEELKHVEQYLWLEKLRFEERVRVVYDIRVSDFSVPALTIQPIVENAVKYGITKKREGGTITIHTETYEDGYRIIITDDGVGFDPAAGRQDSRSHIGITNVRSRLAVLCGGTLAIKSVPDQGTVACIEIPERR